MGQRIDYCFCCRNLYGFPRGRWLAPVGNRTEVRLDGSLIQSIRTWPYSLLNQQVSPKRQDTTFASGSNVAKQCVHVHLGCTLLCSQDLLAQGSYCHGSYFSSALQTEEAPKRHMVSMSPKGEDGPQKKRNSALTKLLSSSVTISHSLSFSGIPSKTRQASVLSKSKREMGGGGGGGGGGNRVPM